MKKVFLTLAIAAIFSLGFVSCATKTNEEVEAVDTEAVEATEEAPVEEVPAEEVPAEEAPAQ